MTSQEVEEHDLSYQEVAEYDGTFEEAVTGDVIPKPKLMIYNEWIAWRKVAGKRPTRALGCDRATTSAEESALWRSMMTVYHGEEWRLNLDAMVADHAEEDHQEAPSTAGPSGSVLGAGVLEELDASAPAGEDQGSDANSTAMSLSGTPEGLQKLLDKHYEPEIESIDRFLTRLNRVAVALAAQDCPVDEDIYRCKYWDAELRAQLHPHNPAQQLAYLKQLFADMVMSTDSEMTDMERDWRLEVVQGRMKDHGFTSPERYVRKLAAGSPPSYQGTPFKFVVPGLPHLSATIPELPTFGAGPQGQRRQGIGSGTPSSGTYGENGQEASMMAEMMDRMERMERHSKEGALAEAMSQQTDMLSRIINKPEGPRRGAIRVEPKVAWPVLDQDNLNVDEFFDEYENICGLANDCRGLGPQEMLLALKASLRGSRLDTYNNMRQICQEDGTLTTDPGGVYAAIKAKLLRFCRTFEEKQTLALTEWGSLFKGALNSLEFETRWDRATRKLQKYGLTRSAEELKITYLCKIN